MVVAQWHPSITSAMQEAATQVFCKAGGHPDNLLIIPCPGAWELAAACGALTTRLDPPPEAIVAIGCVIKGDTPHNHWINHGVCTALADLGTRTGIPVSLGLLTCDTLSQAQARAGGAKGNKGGDAMTAAIELAGTLETLTWSSDS